MSELPKKEPPLSSSVPRRRHNPSLFGPIFLIAMGIYFLLGNLDMLPALYWGAALQLWPLLLIFIGLNIVVRQAPRPLGAILSGLVGLTAVAVFGTVLFFADSLPFINRYAGAGGELQQERVFMSLDGVESANVSLDFSTPGVTLSALDDSPNLIDGQVSYFDQLHFTSSLAAGEARVRLNTTNGGFLWFNSRSWSDFDDLAPWQLGLHPEVPLDLSLDLGAGPAVLDLRGLELRELNLDGASGRSELWLPDGEYEIRCDVGSGSMTINLAEGGRQTLHIDGGSGSVEILLPKGLALRLSVPDGGSGRLNLDTDRLERVEGDNDPDEGVWETAGFDDAQNRVEIELDMGSGSVTISQS